MAKSSVNVLVLLISKFTALGANEPDLKLFIVTQRLNHNTFSAMMRSASSVYI